MASFTITFQGHQRIGFRVIGGRLAQRRVVGQQDHARYAALDAVIPEGNQ